MATGRGQAYSASPEIWGQFGDNTALVPQQHNGHVAESDSIEHLEELAQKAKREAQAKRKQIPPFVQKLSRLVLWCAWCLHM